MIGAIAGDIIGSVYEGNFGCNLHQILEEA